MDVFLKPYRRKIAVAATRMASRCGEPGALLIFTFIGQSRFDEIGCHASRSASPSGCPLRFVKPGAARRPLRHFWEPPMDNPPPGVIPLPPLLHPRSASKHTPTAIIPV